MEIESALRSFSRRLFLKKDVFVGLMKFRSISNVFCKQY